MRKILLGFILGILLSSAAYFFISPNKYVNLEAGRLLERDVIYLEDKSVIKGWITEEDDTQIWIEAEGGFFSIPRSKCVRVHKDVLLRYIRNII